MKNFSGLTITGATPDGYSVKANGYVKGSWLQSSVMQNYGSNTGKVCVFDNSGWIYYRTPAEIVAEAGGGGSTEVVQTTGTSTTSVMSQNATTNAISGKLDKTTYEVNRTINFGQDGALYIGKFKVYDTNVTFEITSTTSVTYSGKLVIAAQNYVISEAKVYGDAANTVAPNIYIKPSSGSDQYIEVYFKPESWSKNVIHIYGSNIQAEPTDVCTSIPSVPSTATLKPKHALPIYSLSGTTFTITF